MINYWYKKSFDEYEKDLKKCYPALANTISQKVKDRSLAICSQIYHNIQIPRRETLGSAGYDFFAPFGFTLHDGESLVIPTGISIALEHDKGLFITPRSSTGIKGLHVTNTVGVIDSDFFSPITKSGGDIFIKLTYNRVHNTVPDFEEMLWHANEDKFASCIESGIHVYTREDKENCAPPVLKFNCGDRIAQGIIVQYFQTENEFWDGGTFKGRHGESESSKTVYKEK